MSNRPLALRHCRARLIAHLRFGNRRKRRTGFSVTSQMGGAGRRSVSPGHGHRHVGLRRPVREFGRSPRTARPFSDRRRLHALETHPNHRGLQADALSKSVGRGEKPVAPRAGRAGRYVARSTSGIDAAAWAAMATKSSICWRVCIAISCRRQREEPRATAGYSTRLTMPPASSVLRVTRRPRARSPSGLGFPSTAKPASVKPWRRWLALRAS